LLIEELHLRVSSGLFRPEVLFLDGILIKLIYQGFKGNAVFFAGVVG